MSELAGLSSKYPYVALLDGLDFSFSTHVGIPHVACGLNGRAGVPDLVNVAFFAQGIINAAS